MARTRQIQNSLITGVISPTLKGRIDLKKYYSAVEEAENMVIMPHGGMERRSGTKYLKQVTPGSRLFSFEFSVTQNYVFTINHIKINTVLSTPEELIKPHLAHKNFIFKLVVIFRWI